MPETYTLVSRKIVYSMSRGCTSRMDMSESLGKRIADLRAARGITQSELGRRAQIAQGHMSRIEAGKQHPQERTIRKIASVLGVSVAELLGEEQSARIGCATTAANAPVPVFTAGTAGIGKCFNVRGYPIRAGESFIRRPDDLVGEKHAYGLRIVGNGMAPAFRPGQIVVVAPSKTPRIGDRVVVRLKDGRLLVREYFRKGGNIVLHPVNQNCGDRVFSPSEVDWIKPIVRATCCT